MKVQLTWKPVTGKVITEEVELVKETDPMYMLDGTPIGKPISFLTDAQDNAVVFEDDEGLFMLTTDQIINIEPVEESNG